VKRLFAAGLLLAAFFAASAGPASGHAVLEGSSPPRGAELAEAPSEVNFTFNEPVEASLGAVRVFDTEGNEVQDGELERPGGSAEAVGATLPDDLRDGIYTATYQVVSADSHPISGGITFTVGNPESGGAAFVQGKTISELLAQNEAGKVTEVAFWADRWIGYLAMSLAIGALIWMFAVWGPSRRDREPGDFAVFRRFRKLMIAVGLAGLLATLAAIPFQGAIGAGTSFWGAFGSGIPDEVIHTRFGTVMLIRAGIWLALLGLILWGGNRFSRTGAVSIAGLALAVLLAMTPAFAGHASTRDPSWLMVPSDIVHVAAMAVWAGGLAAMLWLLPAGTRELASNAERTRLLTDASLRFSSIALVAVALIAVSGTIQAIIDVGSVSALFDTQFGRAVSIKVVLFAVLIGLGAANRRRIIPGLVKRMERSQSPGEPGNRLKRALRIEVVLVAVVLAVSAALVSYPPPDAIQAGPASGSVVVEGKQIEYTVDPARVGSNEVHLYVFDEKTGAPVQVQSMEISFSLPEADIAPIEVEARKAGPGHFVVPGAMLGVRGEWLGSAAIRLSRFEEPLAEFEFEIK
jgi:copper transport protein